MDCICLEIQPTLLKIFKPSVKDSGFQDKRRFDESLNSGKIVIEQAFRVLKNRWRILKILNMGVDMVATITLACCVLHNDCEIFSKRVPLLEDLDQRADHFVGVCRRPLRVPSDGRAGKVVGEQMRATMFEAWVARNPSI